MKYFYRQKIESWLIMGIYPGEVYVIIQECFGFVYRRYLPIFFYSCSNNGVFNEKYSCCAGNQFRFGGNHSDAGNCT